MQIFEQELNIDKISDIKKGNIPISETACKCRHSDCFVYILSGSATYYFNGKPYVARKGDILFLAKNSKYEISVTVPDYDYYCINFFFQTDKQLSNAVFSHENSKSLENVFIKFKQLWTAGDYSDKIYCKSLLYQIYSEIARENTLRYIPKSKKESIESAIGVMQENYCDPEFSIEALCTAFSMSTVHFRRIFSQIYHTSPIKYINSLRLTKAKDLLANTDTKIQHISQLCGFNNPYYFTKVFKENTGMTPSVYRLSAKRFY